MNPTPPGQDLFQSFLPGPATPEEVTRRITRQMMLGMEASPAKAQEELSATIPHTKAEEVAGGVWQGGEDLAGGSARFLASPAGVLSAPLGAGGRVGQRILQAGFGGYMGSQVPEAAREAGRESVEGTLQEAVRADVNLGTSIGLPAVLAKGAMAKGRMIAAEVPEPTRETAGAVSEFGGDAPQALDLQPVVSPESPVLSPQSTLETATPTVQPTVAPVAPGANLNVTDLAATARIAEMPESVDTLNHQLDALRAGKRQAVLFTPGETVPKWAQDSDQYSTHETPAGTFLYDAAEITKDQIDEHVAKNTVGRLLGYGIDAKPAPADTIGAVTVRSAQGIEKQSVLTDKENLPGVLQAAQAMAAPGDSVRLESPADGAQCQGRGHRTQGHAIDRTATDDAGKRGRDERACEIKRK